jgi:transposase
MPGSLQADAYAGFGDLSEARRRPGPTSEARCWASSPPEHHDISRAANLLIRERVR